MVEKPRKELIYGVHGLENANYFLIFNVKSSAFEDGKETLKGN